MERTPDPADEQNDLVSTLEVIQAQPLASRAQGYESLHDALARRLESAPTNTARS